MCSHDVPMYENIHYVVDYSCRCFLIDTQSSIDQQKYSNYL